jgi:hypothetical protein
MQSGYYLTITNNKIYILLSHDNEPLKADDDSWYRIKITQDDYNMYLQALKDKKEIYIDDDGKIQIRYKLEE